MLKKFERKVFTLNACDRSLILGKRTMIMGVVNITPDSFSGDGRLKNSSEEPAAHAAFALKLVKNGADIIDLGGESTRPGARPLAESVEIKRVIPVIKTLRKRSKVFISVDTYKAKVAQLALEAGADILNNVRGTALAKDFLCVAKDYKAAIVLMHSRGTPLTMQKKVRYKDLISDIIDDIRRSVEKCLSCGIKSDNIIIDPGIGFAKTVSQNLEILNRLEDFQKLGLPVLIGASRKSFIGQVLSVDVSHRLWGTAATAAVSVMKGAHILRVHDVKEIRQTVDMVDAVMNISLQSGYSQ